MVFMHHNVPKGATPTYVTNFFYSGYMGVTIFFVLSGFVLTITYLGMVEPSMRSTWNFAVARFARVIPLYWLVLFVVVFIIKLYPARMSEVWGHILAVQAWSSDVNYAYAWNGPGWSIGVEVFLYAAFPVLILLTKYFNSTKKAVAVLCCVALGMAAILVFFHLTGRAQLPMTDPTSAHRWLYRSPLLRLGDFILGMCCAIIYLRERANEQLVRLAPFFAVAAVVAIVVLMVTPDMLLSAASFDFAYAVPGVVLILALALAPDVGIAKILGSVPLVALGEWSYAFYLIHIPLGIFIIRGILTDGFTPLNTAIFASGLLLMVGASWILHIFFERPARVFIRRRLSVQSAD